MSSGGEVSIHSMLTLVKDHRKALENRTQDEWTLENWRRIERTLAFVAINETLVRQEFKAIAAIFRVMTEGGGLNDE
jgi:hypothetical protein